MRAFKLRRRWVALTAVGAMLAVVCIFSAVRSDGSSGASTYALPGECPLTHQVFTTADGSPNARDVTRDRAIEQFNQYKSHLNSKYGSTSSALIWVRGRVWLARSDGSIETRTEDVPLIVEHLRERSECPSEPASFNGVPLAFVAD